MKRKQKGFSLVLSLTLLIAIGGLSLAGKSAEVRLSLSLSSAVLTNGELGQARQALLSYSARYPYLYGPKGAGVGHLPCPDTDALHVRVTSWAVNQGPNPPCGSSPVAVGRLPSHISFPEGRYMIHTGFGPPVEYEVSKQVVNNPAIHSVNPELLSQMPRENLHPVLLRRNALGTTLTPTLSSEILLTKNALMLAVRPAVAAWVTEKIKDLENPNCLSNHAPFSQDSLEVLHERCHQLQQLVFQCRSTEHTQNSELQELLPITRDRTSEQYRTTLRILLLADEVPTEFQCDKSALEQLYIDDVPAKQHWFVRNGWIDWIRIEHEEQCVQFPLRVCRLTYVNLREHENLLEPLVLRWILI